MCMTTSIYDPKCKLLPITHFQLHVLSFHFLFFAHFVFEIGISSGWPGAHYVAQADLELMALSLPQPPKSEITGISHHV